MEKIEVTIDGIKVQTQPGTSILDAAAQVGIKIPSLCYLKGVACEGACRVCVVENKQRGNLATACNTVVAAGQEFVTSSEKVIEARKKNIELLLSNHNKDCLSCGKNLKCRLQALSGQFACNEHKYAGDMKRFELDLSSPSFVRNNNKCILCGRCVAVCKKMQSVSAIAKMNRGFDTIVACAFDTPLAKSECIGCGQCVIACPTGALLDKSDVAKVRKLLGGETKVVAMIAPAVRIALAEEFGQEVGSFCEGKIATALKLIGFDKAFDVNVGADFTVIEEGNEFIKRLQKSDNLPLLTSCCPAWYAFVEKNYPQYVNNISTCKSPNEMLGSLIKNVVYKDAPVKVVSIMPCVAKKHEILHHNDVDVVLTTRELATLIRQKNINFNALADGKFDDPLGSYTSAGLIFGATGGVTEAALRYVAEKVTGRALANVEFRQVRNSAGIKEVSVDIGDLTVEICVVNGLANARKVMNGVESGAKKYHLIEVMACPGGCVNGGGQPFVDYSEHDVANVIKARAAAIFKKDSAAKVRVSSHSQIIKEFYSKFLTGNRAHELLHRHKK